jgi:D-serine dehydratase
VAASRHLALAGVETYEGPGALGTADDDVSAIDELLDWLRSLVVALARRSLFAGPEITVTAGGSEYFDRVVAKLTGWSEVTAPVRLILRSGCYLTQDLGRYHRLSPLDGRREPGEALFLQNALEAWSMALSRPEPGLVILGSGKRDVPYDVDAPIPLRAYRRDGSVADLTGHASIKKVMDQHAFMTIDAQVSLNPGDIVTLGLSHPCTAFDKLRLIPLIDDNQNVVDGVLTFF